MTEGTLNRVVFQGARAESARRARDVADRDALRVELAGRRRRAVLAARRFVEGRQEGVIPQTAAGPAS